MGSKGYLSSLAKVGDCFAGGVQLQQQGRGLLTHRFFDQRDLVGRLPAEKLLQTLGIGLDVPAPASPRACHPAHAARKPLLERGSLPEEFFAPLMAAAVHDPAPSCCRWFVGPVVYAFARRRVLATLLHYLLTGTDAERAGDKRAWYCAHVALHAYRSPAYAPGGRRDPALDEIRDLVDEWLEYAAVPGRSDV